MAQQLTVKRALPGMESRTKSREETFSDTAREERSVEPEFIERVGFAAVLPTHETLAGSIS